MSKPVIRVWVGIEALEVGGFLRPAEGRERPQGRREPGVEHVLVLAQRLVAAVVLRAAAASASSSVSATKIAAVRAVPGRDPMAPPELARDAPGLDVPHPLEVGLFPVARLEDGAAVLHRLDGRPGQGLGVHVPLVGEIGLDHDPGAIAVRHGVAHRLDAPEQAQAPRTRPPPSCAQRSGPGRDRRPARCSLMRACGSRMLIIGRLVTLTDLEVVEVVGRRDLDRAGALLRIGIVVGDDRDRPADDRQAHALADQMRVTRIARMDRDGGVGEHGLRPGGGDDDLAGAVLERIGEMPVVAFDLALLDFEIGDRGLESRVPVHQALVAIDQLLAMQGRRTPGARRAKGPRRG